MYCSGCGKSNEAELKFCRSCGATLTSKSLQAVHDHKKGIIFKFRSKDPDELTSNGIGSVIMGDGFFMVAVILSVTHTPVSSLLWLFLLIPAFFFFGKGFADVFYAKQIRKTRQQNELNSLEQAVYFALLR